MTNAPQQRIRTISGILFNRETSYLSNYAIRYELMLDAAIDPQRMQAALDEALKVCPFMGYSTEMDKTGMYYVPNAKPARIVQKVPDRLGGEDLNGHLFCVACDGCRLEVVIFHGLTDGVGCMWFLDALLGAYYGNARPAYDGVGTEDYAYDLMSKKLDVSEESEPEQVSPERRFSFSEECGDGIAETHLLSFPEGDLRAFRNRMGCSTTAAMVALLCAAIQRANPTNQDPVCVRCPVNVRNMFGVPHTFQNASVPSVIARLDAAQAQAVHLQEATQSVTQTIASQATPARMGSFVNRVVAALSGERTEGSRGSMAAFMVPAVFSNLGRLTPQSAAAHVASCKVVGYGGVPLMAHLVTIGERCMLTLVQSFVGTQYLDALEQVLIGQGISAARPTPCERGRQQGPEAPGIPANAGLPEDMPRFMDRMTSVVRTYGERTALVSDARSVTYAQLDEETGKVYGYLKRHGIGTESIVAVVMPRDVGFFSCVGGVLRAGAAFVPLEDTYPPERIAYIREDSGCTLVLDQPLFEQIMAEEDYLAGHETTDVHDACYVVYTSGSTGNPKGVLHEYGSLDIQALQVPIKDELPVSQRGAMESLYFVAAIFMTVRNLLCAATVHIIDRELVRNLHALSELIDERRIESLFMPPSYARMFRNPGPSLRQVVVGGEPANNLYYPGGVPAVHNIYGMSETDCLVLETTLDRAYDVSPVGTPTVPGIDLHLEDEDGRRVEGPGTGEVCFKNLFFRGYLNLPKRTAAAIRDGVFHTGDLARRDEHGLYYIQGRMDDMFKINGNRIEPAEIEHRVAEVTGLTQVVAKGFVQGSRAFVCAYFLCDEAERLGIWDGTRLTCNMDKLRHLLPDYMIPAHYVALDEFPHNANGKLARIKLKAPEPKAGSRAYVEPASELERLFCDLMAQVLETGSVGATDDFYELGADSMAVVMFVSACADAGYDIPLAMLYKSRTPRALAAACGQAAFSQDARRASVQAAMGRPQPVLANQLANVRQFREAPDSVMFNLPQLLRLKPAVDLERLRVALDKVFAAHPALLSTFREVDGAYYLAYDEDLFEPTEVVRLSEEEFAQTKKTLVAPLQGFGKAPHRRAIFQTDSAAYLFWDLHHSIADGTSLALLRSQVYACYEDPDYHIPEDDYFYYLEQTSVEQTDRSNPVFVEAQDHYEAYGDEVEGVPSYGLRPDLEGPSGAPRTIVGHREHARASDGGSALFLAAAAMAAARLDGRNTALVYTAYHGRNSQAQRQSVGMYATSIPVCLDLARCATSEQVMDDVRAQLDFGMAHCTYPYQWLHPAPQHSTLLFNYQKDTLDLGSIAAIVDKRVDMEMGQNGMIICGLIDRRGIDGLTWFCGYDSGYYSAERMNAFHEEFNKAVAWLW